VDEPVVVPLARREDAVEVDLHRVVVGADGVAVVDDATVAGLLGVGVVGAGDDDRERLVGVERAGVDAGPDDGAARRRPAAGDRLGVDGPAGPVYLEEVVDFRGRLGVGVGGGGAGREQRRQRAERRPGAGRLEYRLPRGCRSCTSLGTVLRHHCNLARAPGKTL
jgi:hypothetical protein